MQDSITEYLDDVPEDKIDITIYHLLTHASGLLRFYGDDFEFFEKADFIDGLLSSHMMSSPGS